MNEKAYQENELKLFNESKHAFFDTPKEFGADLKSAGGDWITEQLEWIENGSYGAGACLALQVAFNSINNRVNGPARIGGVLLHALYGKRFGYWAHLPKDVQDVVQAVCVAWIAKGDKSFAITLQN